MSWNFFAAGRPSKGAPGQVYLTGLPDAPYKSRAINLQTQCNLQLRREEGDILQQADQKATLTTLTSSPFLLWSVLAIQGGRWADVV